MIKNSVRTPAMNLTLRITNYITRYAPSRVKIRDYLIRKKVADPDILLTNMGYDELLMLDIWIRTWIATGKGKVEIERKLRTKGFSPDLIDKKMIEYESEITDWIGQSRAISHQITTLRSRGKSLQHIESTLRTQYPYFRTELHELIGGLDDNDALKNEVQKYKNKYNIHNQKDREKFFAALMRKGFRYGDIKDMLRTEDEG